MTRKEGYAARVAAGYCRRCFARPAEVGRKRCWYCADVQREYNRNWMRKNYKPKGRTLTDHDARIMAPKAKAVDNVAAVRKWRAKQYFCHACGRRGDITAHHLIGGKGGRSDEVCNLIAVCWSPCHELCEGLDVPTPAEQRLTFHDRLLPKLTLPICLSLKLRSAPEEYNAARLEVLLGRPLPLPLPIPAYFVRLWELNTKEKR